MTSLGPEAALADSLDASDYAVTDWSREAVEARRATSIRLAAEYHAMRGEHHAQYAADLAAGLVEPPAAYEYEPVEPGATNHAFEAARNGDHNVFPDDRDRREDERNAERTSRGYDAFGDLRAA